MEYRDDFQVKCPFYIKQNQTGVMCEGLVENVNNFNYTTFQDQSYKKEFMRAKCKCNYKTCEVYMKINEKYEEKQN